MTCARQAGGGRTRRSPVPKTWKQALERCPFRSLVTLVGGTEDEMLSRTQAAFAAIDGTIEPIDRDRLDELVELVLSGATVIVLGTRADLRDAARNQLLTAVNVAALGAAGSA